MKKALRRILVTVGVVLALFVLLMVGLALFLPVDRMAAGLEAEVEKSTGADVSIGGAGLSWWPRLGVSLQDVRFSGTGAQLTAATGAQNDIGQYSGEAGQLLVRVPLKPLLQKEVVVEAASLDGLDLQLVKGGETLVLKGLKVDVGDLQLDLESLPQSAAEGAPVGEMIPESLVLSFEGHAESYSQKGLELTDIKFQGGLDTRILTVEAMEAQLGTGRLQGDLEIDYERDPRGILEFRATAEKVPGAQLVVAWVPALAERLVADLDGEVSGQVTLGTEEVVRSSLTLHGKLSSGEGELKARDWLKDVVPYLGNRQDLVDISFHSLEHALRVDQGRYHVDRLVLDGSDTRWEAGGSVGLDGTLDLKVKVLLPVGFTPELGQWSMLADALRDDDGRVNLDLSVRGSQSKPQVGLNLGSLKDAAQGDAGETVKKGLGGLLDKWKSR